MVEREKHAEVEPISRDEYEANQARRDRECLEKKYSILEDELSDI